MLFMMMMIINFFYIIYTFSYKHLYSVFTHLMYFYTRIKSYLHRFIVLTLLISKWLKYDTLSAFYPSIYLSVHFHINLLVFLLLFCLFLLYPSIKTLIYLRIAVSDDEDQAQCLAQADKVYGCVMECSSLQHGSDVNKLIFWQIKKRLNQP